MRPKHFSILILIAFLTISCATSNTSVSGSWKKKDFVRATPVKKMLVIALAHSAELKAILENELAFQTKKRGIEPVKGSQFLLASLSKEDLPSREVLIEMIKTQNIDAVFVVAVKDKESNTRYVPGMAAYEPMSYGYYGNFYGYYSTIYTMYPVAYEPGYYQTDSVYYLESNLYETKSEELIWSAQSSTYNPVDAEDFAKGYMETIMAQLVKDGIVKPEEKK